MLADAGHVYWASPGSTGGRCQDDEFWPDLLFLKSKIQGYEIPGFFPGELKDEDMIKAFTLVLLDVA
jgi:hypothetical protein